MNNAPAPRRLSRRSLLVHGGLLACTISLMPILAGPASAATHPGQLGIDASLGGRRPFPASNSWNADISQAPIDCSLASILAGIGLTIGLHPDFGSVWNGAPSGIQYVVVPGTQPRVPITFSAYGDESDPGPYPVPSTAPIEGGPNATGDPPRSGDRSRQLEGVRAVSRLSRPEHHRLARRLRGGVQSQLQRAAPGGMDLR
jgi:hypothetical protein